MIVIGPTPFGTGEIAYATSFASSNATSPTCLPSSSLLVPTSTTQAPGFIQSPLTISALPTAATTISPSLTTPGRSAVFEWQTVTVQFFESSNIETGFPTIFDLPITTALFPARIAPYLSRRAIIPAGVAGRKTGEPMESLPTLYG
ncbi:MAG: hypothetical protein BWX90_00197 [bacterium ADurb.Bin132]|nr:MAG: hypothetical protein BWX90_00197 [bacterium ADurb.Bin132]